MAGTVTFKVYMSTADGSSTEVRRFGVDVDAVTNFVYLSEKLQIIFPSLRGKSFTVSWKDLDGDQVVISSDEELQEALTENAGNHIFRLYVSLRSDCPPARDAPPYQNSEPIHIGVICDSCNKCIQGYRYKCIQCPDYDLCMNCERACKHSEHCMLRLSMPLQWKPHYGKRLASHVNRFMRKANSYCPKEEDEPTPQCPFRAGKHHGKYHRNGGENVPSWINTVAAYLDDLANLPGECPVTNGASKAQEATEENVPSSTPRASAACPKEADSTKRDTKKCDSKKCDETNPAEQIKLLTNVGLAMGESFLTQLLDPFINAQTKSEKTATGNAQKPTSTSSPSASVNSEQEVPSSSIKENAAASNKFPGEGKKLNECLKDEAATDASQSGATLDEIRAEPTKRVSFESEGWTLLNKNDTPASSNASPTPSCTDAIPKQAQPSAPAEAPKSIYPSLPEVPQKKPEEVHVVYHPNPTIQKSVESMIQMGFSNEGGWLTNLLVSKSGDIAAALDALSPVRR